jgi:heat shock protein HslJ
LECASLPETVLRKVKHPYKEDRTVEYQQDYQDYDYDYESQPPRRNNRILWIVGIAIIVALLACVCCICLTAGVLAFLYVDADGASAPPPTAVLATEPAPTATIPAGPTSTPTPAVPPQSVIIAPAQAMVGQESTYDGSQSQPGSYPITNYYWDFGDGKTAEGAIVTYAYPRAANYQVTLTVVDESGASSATTHQIVITEEEPIPPQPTPDPAGGLVGPNWKWTELIETGPSLVPSPESYTIQFFEDLSLNLVADCNEGGGTYLVDGNQLSLNLDALSLAACGPESLSDQYIAILGQVVSFERDGERLILYLAEGAGQAVFYP